MRLRRNGIIKSKSEYIITLNTNGGTWYKDIKNTDIINTVNVGESLNLGKWETNIDGFSQTWLMHRAGYIQTGWNTKSDGSGIAYSLHDTYIPTKDATLYAVWTKAHTITFDVNGGHLYDESQYSSYSRKVPYGETIHLYNDYRIYRDGYILIGWNTKADGSGAFYSVDSTYTPTNNVTLYAIWAVTHTVTFDGNGGQISKDNQDTKVYKTVRTGEELLLDVDMYREGYVHNGWNTEPNGKGEFYDSYDTIKVDNNITLYAIWEKVYVVTINYNNREYSKQSDVYNVKIGDHINSYSQDSFNNQMIVGYSLSPNTVPTDVDNIYNSEHPFTPTENVTLYAVWAPCYTITFIGNYPVKDAFSATDSYFPLTEMYGKEISLKSHTYLTGYIQTGWNTERDGSGTFYSTNDVITVTQDVNLYGVWKIGPKLQIPTGLRLEGKYLKWNAVDHATCYKVYSSNEKNHFMSSYGATDPEIFVGSKPDTYYKIQAIDEKNQYAPSESEVLIINFR